MRRLLSILALSQLLFLGCGSTGSTDFNLPQEQEGTTGLQASTAFSVTNPSQIGADAGTTCDGCTLAAPTGFTLDECVFSVSLTSTSSSDITRRTFVNNDGLVSCEVYSTNEQGELVVKSCAPSFMMICAK